jgi:hypothetical protein
MAVGWGSTSIGEGWVGVAVGWDSTSIGRRTGVVVGWDSTILVEGEG